MAQAALDRVLEEIKTLKPDDLRLVEVAIQAQLVQPENGKPSGPIAEGNAWDVLEELMGTVTAPSDWAEEHDHYLSATPKRHTGGPT